MIKLILNSVLPVLCTLPLILIFVKDRLQYKTIGLFLLIAVTYGMLLLLPSGFERFQFIKGHWNWTGKIYAIIFGLTIYKIIENRLKPNNFIRLNQEPTTHRKTIIVVVILTLLSAIAGFMDKKMPFDTETLWYQASMPGIDEEIMFRGVLLGILMTCLKDKIGIGKYNLGSPAVLIIAIMFGNVHAIHLSDDYKFSYDIANFLGTGLIGYILGWITLASKSILKSVIAHNLFNFVATFIGMM